MLLAGFLLLVVAVEPLLCWLLPFYPRRSDRERAELSVALFCAFFLPMGIAIFRAAIQRGSLPLMGGTTICCALGMAVIAHSLRKLRRLRREEVGKSE